MTETVDFETEWNGNLFYLFDNDQKWLTNNIGQLFSIKPKLFCHLFYNNLVFLYILIIIKWPLKCLIAFVYIIDCEASDDNVE